MIEKTEEQKWSKVLACGRPWFWKSLGFQVGCQWWAQSGGREEGEGATWTQLEQVILRWYRPTNPTHWECYSHLHLASRRKGTVKRKRNLESRDTSLWVFSETYKTSIWINCLTSLYLIFSLAKWVFHYYYHRCYSLNKSGLKLLRIYWDYSLKHFST